MLTNHKQALTWHGMYMLANHKRPRVQLDAGDERKGFTSVNLGNMRAASANEIDLVPKKGVFSGMAVFMLQTNQYQPNASVAQNVLPSVLWRLTFSNNL